MGTPAFAVPSLSVLARTENVTLVVTNPDRPSGRGQALSLPPVKGEAHRLGLPVFQPEKAKHPDSVARIASEKPDLIVVAAYGQILPKSILDIPARGCINVHASLLPKYRGAAPINWAVARGETMTGVTIMKMDIGMDTGLHGGTLSEIPQDNALATYAPMLKKEHGQIDWSRPAAEVRNLIRGMASWPSAFTSHAGKALKIFSASVREGRGEPGEILEVGRDGLVVACGDGALALGQVQPEGCRAMSSRDYARGRRVTKGERLSR
jgi:methionyl-tRNA formyltransferase